MAGAFDQLCKMVTTLMLDKQVYSPLTPTSRFGKTTEFWNLQPVKARRTIACILETVSLNFILHNRECGQSFFYIHDEISHFSYLLANDESQKQFITCWGHLYIKAILLLSAVL